jgi:hypothetical protein
VPSPLPCSPDFASVGDVGAALMLIDSKLTSIYSGSVKDDPEQRAMTDQVHAAMGEVAFEDLVDGVCTLIYGWMDWLRQACADHDQELIEYVVPGIVGAMRQMKTIPAEAIPTMAGLLVAAGTGLSPSLWRAQYGGWTRAEMNSLEGTAVLLADLVNRTAGGDREFATRLIASAMNITGLD